LLATITFIINGYCAVPPFGFDGSWYIHPGTAGTSDKYVNIGSDRLLLYYENLYGVNPGYILWEGDEREIKLLAQVTYIEPCQYEWDPSNLPDSITWGDLRPYVFFRLTRFNVDTSFVFQCPFDQDKDTVRIKGKKYKHNLMKSFIYNLWDLPIPQDTSVWKISLEVHTSPTDTGSVLAKSGDEREITVLRSPIMNAIDSLQWVTNYDRLDKQVAKALLPAFPYNNDLIWFLFSQYLEEDSCQIARFYGVSYANAMQYQLDVDKQFPPDFNYERPFGGFWDPSPKDPIVETYELYLEHCGE